MSEQTTGRHLSQQPDEERNGRSAESEIRPVSTARMVRPGGVDRDGPVVSYRPVRTPVSGKRGKKPLDLFVRVFVLVLLFASMAALVFVLVRTKMLTGRLLLVICGLLIVIFAIMAVLMFVFGKRRPPWGVIVVSLLLTAVMTVGSVFGNQGTETLRNITDSHTYSLSHVSVYVRDDDPAQTLEEIGGYTFGVMETMGRESVDKAVGDLNERLGTSIQTVGFDMPTKLVGALFDGSIDAVISDVAYIDGLRELENYTDLVGRMRELTEMHMEIVQVTPEPTAVPAEPVADDHVYTVLITGIDSRNGLVRSSLSDVNILATVNTDTHQALFVSTPRDYKVVVSSTGEADKLTHAGWYGEEVCMETIGDLYDVDVDYYFRINFEGFVNIIDALGGITINCPYTFDSMNVPGYHFDEGEIKLDGERALVFVRERFAFEDGDAQRGRNQLEVIRGVIKAVMSPELLANYSSLLTAVGGSFETTVPYDLIASLIRRQLDEGGDWNIVSYSVSGTDAHEVSPALGESVYMMIPDEATVQTAKDMMARVSNGEILNEEGVSIGT